jgi:hypothetical protein
MSKKIEICGNNIIIPFGRKNTCRTLNDANPDNYNWEKTDITFSGTFQYFEVYYSQDHPNYDIILKPSKIYFNKIFEDIFGFGFNCQGYDVNKVVAIF